MRIYMKYTEINGIYKNDNKYICFARAAMTISGAQKAPNMTTNMQVFLLQFHADVKKSARKGPINDSVEQLLSYPFPEIGEITMQNDWKSIRGVAKTHVLHFRKSSKIPTYLLWYFDDLETRFPEFHDFHPKRYILCFKRQRFVEFAEKRGIRPSKPSIFLREY